MRPILIAVGIVALVSCPARAGDAEAIVEKAVQVTANSDLRLNRLANVIRTERGAFFPPAGEVPAQRTAYLAQPDGIKYDARLTRAGQQGSMVLAVNGLSGWKMDSGTVQDLKPEEKAALDGDAAIWGLITLLPLRAKGTTLSALPERLMNGKKAVGVNVVRPNKSDAQVYFAVDTGLPLRVTAKSAETGFQSTRDWDLLDYRDFDGIKLPTRITGMLNGRKIEEWTVQSYRFPDRLEDKVFQKPK